MTWSADMTVVEYGPRSIGAGSAAQFSNQMGRAGLRAKWLWYDPVARKLKLGFDDSLDDAEALTLHVGAVSLGFPANSGGDSSFSLEHVDIAWTDGETLAVRVSKPSAAGGLDRRDAGDADRGRRHAEPGIRRRGAGLSGGR